jgi:general secretion pathway protein G
MRSHDEEIQDKALVFLAAEALDALVHKPANLTNWNGPYLAKAVPPDPWGGTYVYRCPGKHGDYDLFSYGRDGVEGGEGRMLIS